MSEEVRLYAGTQHGLIVWRSAANGWQEVARHFADGIIDSIHGCNQSSETVFVGVTHDGLYRTVDGGKSWAKVFEGDIRSVTVDPNDDQVVYTGIEPVGLFRSEDGGDSWQEIAALKALAAIGAKKLVVSASATPRPRAQHSHPPGRSENDLSVSRTWGHRAQLRSRQDLGRCQQGNRLSRHSCHFESAQAQRSLLRR